MRRFAILVVEDDPAMRSLLEEELGAVGHTVVAAANGDEALAACDEAEFDVVLSDLMMPGLKGLDLVRELRARVPGVPLVILTAFATIESTVDVMKAGAYYLLPKPCGTAQLLETVGRAIRERSLERELESHLRRAREEASPLIAESAAMRRVRDMIARAAAVDSVVLVLGESGSGKEVVARAIHALSRRHRAPFLALNCSAIPEALLESQLYGHRRGAFTDARDDRPGLFLEANGGTIFLDEIGDMPLPMQAKLLRVLQQREVHPVGAAIPVPVDVRVIAATHRNLETLVRAERFREDLYYRLNVICVHVPPLRERHEDLIPLVAGFLEKHAARLGRPGCRITAEALELLRRHAWPGNVRELENVLERGIVLCEGDAIEAEDLPETLRPASAAPRVREQLPSLPEMEQEYILKILRAVDGNKAAAARLLKVDRKTLYRKLAGYGIPETPGRP